jgi:glycosyltransferase involved in cell wall biosynthesis
MLAADRVLFNSQFHRDDWFEELPRMLKHFPDCSHVPMVPEVRSRTEVLPVGCNLHALDEACAEASTGAPLILWNQRWEYDKDPQTFFRALDVLVARDLPFRVALAGSNVRQQPEEFEAARARLGERVIHYGRADRQTYQRLLWESDVVVSTARHEFFGIAVVEAVYCRCFPVLPRRLAYPEIIPQAQHDRCLYDDFDGLIARLTWALTHPDPRDRIASALRSAVAPLDWSQMAPRYDELMDTVVTSP